MFRLVRSLSLWVITRTHLSRTLSYDRQSGSRGVEQKLHWSSLWRFNESRFLLGGSLSLRRCFADVKETWRQNVAMAMQQCNNMVLTYNIKKEIKFYSAIVDFFSYTHQLVCPAIGVSLDLSTFAVDQQPCQLVDRFWSVPSHRRLRS
jgi:hypothetical protein